VLVAVEPEELGELADDTLEPEEGGESDEGLVTKRCMRVRGVVLAFPP
jgi:hypothetical protein